MKGGEYMLKGIPSVISPDLLKALAEMGHGDMLVIADDFYPSNSMAQSGTTIHADGISAVDMLDAILQLMPLDVNYEEHPVKIISDDPAIIEKIGRPTIWDDFKEVVKKHETKGEACVGFVDRYAFYELGKKAYVTISTGERQPYGCVVLQKGVM